ncbi:MAG TPA: SUMF1/EgtB/PvdO family nonheme iron enzyme, partial [Puia sp.]
MTVNMYNLSNIARITLAMLCCRLIAACGLPAQDIKTTGLADTLSCRADMPVGRAAAAPDIAVIPEGNVSHAGMVRITGGEFMMGSNDEEGRSDEYPAHAVRVSDFWMDAHEVTNAEFDRFVKATGYITIAEKAPQWSVLAEQLPPGTPKPPDSMLVAGALVFSPPHHAVPLDDPSQWWRW